MYIGGKIGILANGAGLAMASMDIVKLYGGEPSNFLDIGGGASPEQILEAIKLLESDPQVTTIFINIFGGIIKCDFISAAIIKEVNDKSLKKPLVLRFKGNNMEKAKKMFEKE